MLISHALAEESQLSFCAPRRVQHSEATTMYKEGLNNDIHTFWLIGIKSIPFRYWMCSWMVSNPPTLAPVKYSNQTENFLILSRILEWYSCTNIHHTYNIVFGRAGGKLCITRIVGHRSQSPPFVPPWPTIVCPKVRALSGLIWLWLLCYTSWLGNVQVLYKHFWGRGVWPDGESI